MAAQHLYREGNQWGMTVAELVAKVAAEGLPVKPDRTGYLPRTRWRVDITPTVVMPRVS